ncbi:MAG TPA: PGPGW domain-containing protein [Candidatus Nitrosotenuis sp.]|nr:PGPGW domain-containing protein [Candidatus Nitrosotenuis sp.]
MFLKTVQQVKRFFIILFGLTVLLAGVVMLVTPGPGWAVIIGGLAILAAAEVMWAKRLLARLKEQGVKIKDAILPGNSARKNGDKQNPPATAA